jgi:FixJ family two-component response regulator
MLPDGYVIGVEPIPLLRASHNVGRRSYDCILTSISPPRAQRAHTIMTNSKTPAPVLVSVVDDDESVRESLPDLLRELGFTAQAFASAEAFLAAGQLDQTGCLILDVSMPGMSGPGLKQELERRGLRIPVVFITAHAEAAARSNVIAGAAACLIKPFSDTALHDALRKALGL